MMDKYSPYKRWIESEGVPIIGGAFVQDVRTEKLQYWKRKDCKGAICTFSDQRQRYGALPLFRSYQPAGFI